MPFNDITASIQILQRVRDNLAGVIIEPVLGGGGCIPATKEYMIEIQQFVHSINSLFILDEIVTGFRFRYGCLYPTMNLDPDIVTLGKIVGGGFPIGVICGKDEIMRIIDTSTRGRDDRSYVVGGTFSANPMTMTSGRAMLEHLKKHSVSVYKKIGALGEKARKGLVKSFDGKAVVTGIGSLFMPHFLANGITEVKNASDASMCDTKLLQRYHFEMIAKDSIFFLPGKLGAISYVHTDSDIKDLIEASSRFAGQLNQ